jgi:hypothetical protein
MTAFIIQTNRGYFEDFPRRFLSFSFPIKLNSNIECAMKFPFESAAWSSIKKHKLNKFSATVESIEI